METYRKNSGLSLSKKSTFKRKRSYNVPHKNSPRPPRTAYIWFCNTYRSSVQLRYPNILHADAQKVLGVMWREISPAQKDIFKSLAEQERLKFEQSNRSRKSPPMVKHEFLTAAIKKQTFDFDFPPELSQTPIIPDLNSIKTCESEWKSAVDELVVEDLGFDHLCEENEGREIALEHESVTRSNEKVTYYEVHVVKTPEVLKNKGYDLVISDELPQKLFESPDNEKDLKKRLRKKTCLDTTEPPELESCFDSTCSNLLVTDTDDMEMPILEKQND